MTEHPLTSNLSERTLLRGYGMAELRRCACGGWITAEADDPHHVESQLRAHQETDRHGRWRLRSGL